EPGTLFSYSVLLGIHTLCIILMTLLMLGAFFCDNDGLTLSIEPDICIQGYSSSSIIRKI
ncbi:hypothetical protein Ga0466249_005386, partial [Sporomusaceae bacterium BoRhaA]|uniref:hypothetical protein n=1 Tax=Pelorhabdus rhamnosifermentans TaxID=2772457 RepID=UPI001C06453A